MFYTYRKVLVIISLVFCLFSSVYAYSGGSGEPNNPYQIATVSDWNDLMNTSADWNKNFIMTADVNLQGIALTPVGNLGKKFTGIFDGNGHIIRNAAINNVGLFGYVNSSGQIRNLGIEDVNVIGNNYIGGLVGWNDGNITACHVTGTIAGDTYVGGLAGFSGGSISNCYSTAVVGSDLGGIGGLVGQNYGGSINNCYSTSAVSGSQRVGGLVGENYGGNIDNCYSTGAVTSSGVAWSIGGLVGFNLNGGSISNCYSTGSISGYCNVGGLVGENYGGSISNCYSTGAVSSCFNVGGLVGFNFNGGSINNCYSTGAVSGFIDGSGGLVGVNDGGSISNCYSIGDVNGISHVGGLVGYNYPSGSIISCYFLDTAGPDNSLGEPLSDEQMKQQASFIGWDFSYTDGDKADWFIQIDEYPILTWQISPADIYTDGRNNFRDFAMFTQYWMREDCRIYNDYCDWADLNFDGSVDADDLIELMSYWLASGIYE